MQALAEAIRREPREDAPTSDLQIDVTVRVSPISAAINTAAAYGQTDHRPPPRPRITHCGLPRCASSTVTLVGKFPWA